ncbi:elongator complex protein 1 [Bactrocera dorsalis]|uniref:Elongator complex protein 1 n=1 Tax=Bactrocera dorsalis TaxID=27457 RepID=A0A6J0RQA1_BACDO|nr:elongator complex protein 1 [Bactrocera dorsalis]
MRNLKLKSCKQLSAKVHNVKHILLNPNISRKETDEIVHVVSDDKLFEIKTVTGDIKEIAAVPGIVGAEYLALNDEICLATEAGEVLAVSPSSGAINECTFCDVGLEKMSWSPDQEVGVFITKANTLVLMTCTYDVINEHKFKENCDPESQFVNVGWGKKETQFHGSEGKAAAKQKSDFKPPENVEKLPQNIEITWRADSSYFVVSFVNNEVGRMFKIFKKEGELSYISERLQGLQYPVAWRPSGNWIAMPQILPNKSTISLFEKNGLRHREITLPFEINEEPIHSLRWSNDSDILSVETLDASTGKNYIYLYTIGNYHWYLKQVLTFEQTDRISHHCWDQRIGEEKTLHIWLENGRYLIYRWHSDFDRFERSGLVIVIDGPKLLFTDFSKAIPPPPMCSKEFYVDAYINAVAITETHDEELQLYVYDAKEQIQVFHVINGTYSISLERICILQRAEPKLERYWSPPIELGNFFVLDEKHLVATANIAEKSKVFLLQLSIETKSYQTISTLKLNSGAVCSCMGFDTLEQFFVQTLNGKVHQISIHNESTLKLDKVYQQLDHGALAMEWYQTQSAQADCLISLLHNQRIYIDNELIAGDVTSFCLAGNYLAYTKLSELNFMLLATRQHAYKRNMERGGRLVTTIANDARVVLQMPRGNLEVICPRVLALEIIGQMLDKQRYREAFNMLRKQRINLNIICDHNMINFVKNVDVFLKQITNPQWLNLFLTDLQNEDFSKTMYASNYTAAQQTYPEGFKITSKVNYICTLLYKYMSENDQERFRLPIITGFVKIGKIEEALLLVWEAKKQQNLHAKYVDNSMLGSAEEALKHLLYLVDVNELYNVALGTYDFGLVLYVAQKSQKDPKEFLPFLNELKQLEMNYRHYKIDLHLKRYEKALENIAKCGFEKFDEALEFLDRHRLYKEAFKYYNLENGDDLTEPEKENLRNCHIRICLAYADHLRSENDLASASIMYERGGNLAQALLCSKHILDWRRVLMLAQKDAKDLGTVALSMLPALLEHGQYQVAHELQKTYGTNFKEAIKYLLKGHLYFQAIVEVNLNSGEVALLEEYVKPELLAYVKQLQQQLSDDETVFIAHKERLCEVRVLAQQKRDGLFNGDEVGDIDEADLLSDTTSMRSSRYTGSSQGTGKTFRSAKNRRKHERKLLSLKPGNPFEDIALIDALHNEVMKLVNQQEQVRDTCKALMELQMDEPASSLQKQYAQMLTLLQDSFDTIWTEEMASVHTMQYKPSPTTDYTQLQNEQRYALLAPQKRFKPQIDIIDWMCKILA